MNVNDKTFLTKDEAAEYLGVSPRTLLRWTVNFDIPFSLVNKRRYFKRLALDRFLESRGQGVSVSEKGRKRRRSFVVPFDEDCTTLVIPPDPRKAKVCRR